MEMQKTERIDHFLIINNYDERKQLVIKNVFLDYVPVARFYADDINERKLAAISLVERGLCNKTTAGKVCNFHRNTVSKLLQIKNLLGIEAVLKDERGLKGPYKYNDEICSYIVHMIEQHPDWTDQAIADQASKSLDKEISRSAVARIRTKEQKDKSEYMLPNKNELIEIAKTAEIIDQVRYDERQLRLNFENDPVLKDKSELFSKEPEPEARRETDQFLISRLKQGERCAFAGGLMHHLFLHEIGFSELINTFPLRSQTTYQSTDILSTLFHSITQGIASIEALKLVNASQLGILIGCNRAPEKETIRNHLQQMANLYLSNDLIDRFARRLLERNQIDKEVFFIDGHFLPYYGLQIIAKGYYTVRRLAMKGNEIYAITDIEGRPLFFITESNEIDFRPIISRCVEKIIGFGISRPLLVFDREGYGIHFFKELKQKIDFITWAKYVGEQSLNRIPETSFQIGLIFKEHKYMVAEQMRTVTESIQTAQKEGRIEPTSVELRLVVIKDVVTEKRMGIYTSDIERPAWKIAYYMLQRWGDSENFFKEMMSRFNLNYHPGYDIKELEKQPLVENPDIPLIRKAIQVLRKEVKELENQLLITEAKYMKRSDKRLKTKHTKLQSELEEKKNDIDQFEKKLKFIPNKVSILDLLKGKPMSRCDLEKKKLYDLIQFMAFHSREMLVNLFRKCYDDQRDIKQVLDMITTWPGYVKLIGKTLVVILDWIENKKHRQAAERFCHLLNQSNIIMCGRLQLKLFFRVSCILHHDSNRDAHYLHILS